MDPTPGLTNISASLNGTLAWAGCVVESPEYITNGLVTFHFTSSSHSTSATYNVGTTKTYAEVSNVQLNAATTYSVYASCTATNGTAVTSSSTSLTTAAASSTAKPSESWLELPAEDNGKLYPNAVELKISASGERNYTAYYDKSTYTSMWTAYPLQSKHMGSLSRPSKWYFNTEIDQEYQVDLTSSSYEGSTYSRGHLIPNASRNGDSEMQKQTFYVTNSVPQVQNSFNSGIWSSLENALQSMAKGGETLYIVTGVAFQKVGESKSVSYIKASDDTKNIPIPNYFYKIVLKVTTNSSGTVTSASTIGFWFENKAYSNSTYSNCAVSVDQVEQWTGFDFFANLPDGIETSAESNTNWNTFQSF